MKKIFLSILFFSICFSVFGNWHPDINMENYFHRCHPDFNCTVYRSELGHTNIIDSASVDFEEFITQVGIVIEGLYYTCLYYTDEDSDIIDVYFEMGYNLIIFTWYVNDKVYEVYVDTLMMSNILNIDDIRKRGSYVIDFFAEEYNHLLTLDQVVLYSSY